jgi:hypothetical protein
MADVFPHPTDSSPGTMLLNSVSPDSLPPLPPACPSDAGYDAARRFSPIAARPSWRPGPPLFWGSPRPPGGAGGGGQLCHSSPRPAHYRPKTPFLPGQLNRNTEYCILMKIFTNY